MDYKEWIIDKAQEIAVSRHGCNFTELPEGLRQNVYLEAIEEYKDYLSDVVDTAKGLLASGKSVVFNEIYRR